MKTIRTIIGEAVGEASMCWSETPTGVFDSTRASKIVDRVLNEIQLLENDKTIHIGDFVKVRKNGERFWCQVLEMDGQNIKARVDSHVIGQDFSIDDILNFTSADVIDCKKFEI